MRQATAWRRPSMQRFKEARKQNGHGWTVNEGRQSRPNQPSIMVTVKNAGSARGKKRPPFNERLWQGTKHAYEEC